jgi:hypothetical protein
VAANIAIFRSILISLSGKRGAPTSIVDAPSAAFTHSRDPHDAAAREAWLRCVSGA